ncbi:P-loop containing nucleoside triphosphate hydrolase protein [Cladochytrium replicatum]|nr:P-loop containing nucleoside triphosphate hydrolase protein [Cladochytrium replicatum]
MGASGAGKTSLLNVIAGEANAGVVKGSILINGKEFAGSSMKKVSGFVFQDDVILATMTCREAITMSALLRLPKKMTLAEKLNRVDSIISLLGLEKAANTVIGSPAIKGLSGGERKRTAMAMEMICDPYVLFCDEPTSGLDTFTSFSVIRTLKSLAETGRTIIATIHQPSSEIFHLFDDLLLLSEGRIMYAGEAHKAIDYFASLGYPCPTFTNANFFFMSILSNVMDEAESSAPPLQKKVDEGTEAGISPKECKGESLEQRLQRLLDTWEQSAGAKQITSVVENPAQGGVAHSAMKSRCSFVTQFQFLFTRASRNAFRNPYMIRAKFGQSAFVGLLVGLIYFGVNSKVGYAGQQDRTGVLFFLTINNVMSNAIGILSIFAAEKQVFQREYANGYYSLSGYFLSKVSVEVPFQLIFPWIQVSIVYWMVGLQNTAEKYFTIVMFTMLSSIVGFSLGVFFACLFDQLPAALAATPLVLLPLMWSLPESRNNSSLVGIKYISPMKYGFEGMIKSEFQGLVIPGADGITKIRGEDVIRALSFADDGLTVAVCAIVMVGLAVGLMLLAYGALWKLVGGQRRATFKK